MRNLPCKILVLTFLLADGILTADPSVTITLCSSIKSCQVIYRWKCLFKTFPTICHMTGLERKIFNSKIHSKDGGTNDTITPTSAEPSTASPTTSPASSPAPTTTTTQPPPTTTITEAPTTTTTEAPIVIGSSCDTDVQCQNGISGEVNCSVNGNCSCKQSNFPANETSCLHESILQPTISELQAETRKITFKIVVEESVRDLNLTFKAEVLAQGSNKIHCHTDGSGTVNCENLLPGTQYNGTAYVMFGEYQKHAIFTETTVPVPPETVNVISQETSAILSWVHPNGRVDYYIAHLRGSDQTRNSTYANATFSSLTPAMEYTVELSAYSYGKKSSIYNRTFTTLSGVPGPPTNLSAGPISEDTIFLEWIAPKKPNGTILLYEVCWKYKVYIDDDFTDGGCTNSSGSALNTPLSSLSPGSYYLIRAYTINDRYKSNASDELLVRTYESTPGKVKNLDILPGNRSLTVKWTRPTQPNGDILGFRLQWKKNESQAYECTVFLKSPNFTESGNSSCEPNHSDMNITVNQKDLSYVLDDLEDYRAYNVSVTAYTIKGPGETKTDSQQTSIAKPEPVSNVTVENVTSTSATVYWALPNDNPGPVTYVVQIKDLVYETDWQSLTECSFQGKNWTSCNIEDLYEYWNYRLRVEAYTDAGNAFSEYKTFTTLEGVPGNVQEPIVSKVAGCDATSIRLQWTEPALVDRNSKITHYVVNIKEDGYNSMDEWEYPVANPEPYRKTDKQFDKIVEDKFLAESTYNCEIYALSSTGLIGNMTSFGVTTSSCPPPVWMDGVNSAIKSGRQGMTTITVTYPAKFFGNTKQGKLTETGYLVTKDKEQLDSINIGQILNWNYARQKNFGVPYKIDLNQQSKRRRRNVPQNIQGSGDFEIGANSSCSTNMDNDYFCNGPLPSPVSVYVQAYACTNAGCTQSKPFGPFQTLAPEPDSGSDGWLVAVILLSIIAIALCSVVALMYFKGIDPRGWLRKSKSTDVPDKLEGELDNVITTADIPRHRPLLLSRYDEELEALRRDTNLKFSDQYVDIGKLSEQVTLDSTQECAILEPNKAKNRWVNILPYDHSRVKLQQLDEDDPSSDYINANYIPGYNTRREYIATQGPLPGTVDDFWRMVWEHNVQMIVMLTQCKEGNRVKCEMYWPDVVNEPKQYGDVVVNPVSTSTVSKYNIIIFDVSVNNQHRQVYHFHYLHFPDFSANVEFDVFIEFVQVVRSHVPHDMAGPIVAHCSAGVGRTGTFIAVDRLDQYLCSENFSFDDTVDIFNIVMSMRENRVMMVQTESQYIMIHDCLRLLLEAKKQAMLEADSDENLYANDGFDPYPEVLYENVGVNGEPKTEL